MSQRVRDFYDLDPEREWQRLPLKSPAEYYTLTRVLREYFSDSEKRVLDLGAGPGRLSIELAKQGHSVTLADLSEANIEFACHKAEEFALNFERVLQADARNLASIESDAFDAVLSLGPMYHLITQEDRDCANAELYRVLKPGALAFVAFLSKSSVIRDNFLHEPKKLHDRRERYTEFLRTGVLLQPPASGFVDLFAVHPDEIEKVMESSQLETLELIGCEGGMAFLQHEFLQLDDEAARTVMEFNFAFVRDRTMLYASDHLLYVGRKR